jgi:hypothetical protein
MEEETKPYFVTSLQCKCNGGDITIQKYTVENCRTLSNLVRDIEWTGNDSPIELMNISIDQMQVIDDFCRNHEEAIKEIQEQKKHSQKTNAKKAVTGTEKVLERTFPNGKVLPVKDLDYCQQMNTKENCKIFDLILATNFLDCVPLFDAACAVVGETIQGKLPNEIRETYGMKEEFTPEQYELILQENKWPDQLS